MSAAAKTLSQVMSRWACIAVTTRASNWLIQNDWNRPLESMHPMLCWRNHRDCDWSYSYMVPLGNPGPWPKWSPAVLGQAPVKHIATNVRNAPGITPSIFPKASQYVETNPLTASEFESFRPTIGSRFARFMPNLQSEQLPKEEGKGFSWKVMTAKWNDWNQTADTALLPTIFVGYIYIYPVIYIASTQSQHFDTPGTHGRTPSNFWIKDDKTWNAMSMSFASTSSIDSGYPKLLLRSAAGVFEGRHEGIPHLQSTGAWTVEQVHGFLMRRV